MLLQGFSFLTFLLKVVFDLFSNACPVLVAGSYFLLDSTDFCSFLLGFQYMLYKEAKNFYMEVNSKQHP